DTAAVADSAYSKAGVLYKKKSIGIADTAWKCVSPRIPGAPQGISYGRREYAKVDYNLFNDVRYEYKLVALDTKGASKTYGPIALTPLIQIPKEFALMANFPNPFRAMTFIRFALPVKTKVDLTVYNLAGRVVCKLTEPQKVFDPGYYNISWNARDLHNRPVAAGPYIYRIVADRFTKAHIMIMVR
ncbi:MAG: T9SS type A sorting domain-containing protein, partial [Chitinivibrionales bacterium]|nr:T9SS type A sorting domain-containing protein [Chitinivibrionales bacterium]